MRHIALLVLAWVAATPASAVPVAAQAPTGPEVALPFFGQDGMGDYRIDGTRGIYINAQTDGKWYYLHIQPDCPRLAQEQGFRIDTSPNGRLEKGDAIIVGGQRCVIAGINRSPVPPGYKTLK